MDTHKSAADRLRPVLRAMEHSIDAARRKRVNIQDPPIAAAPATQASHIAPPAQSALSASSAAPSPAQHAATAPLFGAPPALKLPTAYPQSDSSTPGRLKARPKRPGSLFSTPPGPAGQNDTYYRSQAG